MVFLSSVAESGIKKIKVGKTVMNWIELPILEFESVLNFWSVELKSAKQLQSVDQTKEVKLVQPWMFRGKM